MTTLNASNIQAPHRVFSPEFKHLSQQRTLNLEASPSLIAPTQQHQTYYLTGPLVNMPTSFQNSQTVETPFQNEDAKKLGKIFKQKNKFLE